MTTPTTPVDLDAIAALAEAATPGPWHVGYEDGSGESSIVAWEHEDALGLDATVVMGGDVEGVTMGARSQADARYIAALPPDVALALVEAARALPEDPWIIRSPRVPYNVCYSCHRRTYVGHAPDCQWRIASDALRGVPPATEEDRS